MGADFRDFDNDGREDVFVTALTNETFPLFRNLGKGFFLDVTHPSLVGRATLPASGWSTGIFDFNNDGYKDIFVAAGDVQDNTELLFSRKSRQSNLVLANLRNGKFAAQSVGREALHRGAAFGDFDGDGRVDAVVTRLNEPVALYRNTSPAVESLARIASEGQPQQPRCDRRTDSSGERFQRSSSGTTSPHPSVMPAQATRQSTSDWAKTGRPRWLRFGGRAARCKSSGTFPRTGT